MKNFSQFLKEEVDLKGNKGVPSDFMSKAKQQAAANLGFEPETNRPFTIDGPNPATPHHHRTPIGNIGALMAKSTELLTRGLSRDQIEDRYTKLEDLAKRVIMDEYGDIIEASEKPVELMIRLVRPSEDILSQLPELLNVSRTSEERPEYNEPEGQDAEGQEGPEQGQDAQEAPESGQDQAQPQQEEEDDFWACFADDTDYSDQEEENPEAVEEIEVTNKDVAMAIDKKKILNMLTQGEGKATKDIIKFSDVVEEGLREIMGDSYREILKVWSDISELAHKLDWNVRDDNKAGLMIDAPGGLAGAVDVAWESLSNERHQMHLLTEDTDFNKIVIRAFGVDFPMLIHESVKGIYMLLQSSAIKKDKELAQEIKRATSSFMDESQDFKYGVPAQGMFRDFINKCKDSQKYRQMRTRVFAFLAIDKGRGGAYTDEEFLEITKSLFSAFDTANEAGKIVFKINEQRFAESKAKVEIEKIIADIVKAEDEYREAMNRWEMEQRFGGQEPEKEEGEEGYAEPGEESQSEIDRLIRQSAEREADRDESQLSKRELQELIDAALDEGDFEEVKRLSAFLKEGAEIYLREIEKINESKITNRR